MNARSGVNAEDSAHLRRRARRNGTEDVYRVGAASYRVAVQEHHDLRQPRRCGVWVWRESAKLAEWNSPTREKRLRGCAGGWAMRGHTHYRVRKVSMRCYCYRTNCTVSSAFSAAHGMQGGAALLAAVFRIERSKWGPHGLCPAYREGGSWAVGCAPNAGLPRAP
jgi:hypothetical protein